MIGEEMKQYSSDQHHCALQGVTDSALIRIMNSPYVSVNRLSKSPERAIPSLRRIGTCKYFHSMSIING